MDDTRFSHDREPARDRSAYFKLGALHLAAGRAGGRADRPQREVFPADATRCFHAARMRDERTGAALRRRSVLGGDVRGDRRERTGDPGDHRHRTEARAVPAGRERRGDRDRRGPAAVGADRHHRGHAAHRSEHHVRQRFQHGEAVHPRGGREHVHHGQRDGRGTARRRRRRRARGSAAHVALRSGACRGSARSSGEPVRTQCGRRLHQSHHRQTDGRAGRLRPAHDRQLRGDRRGRCSRRSDHRPHSRTLRREGGPARRFRPQSRNGQRDRRSQPAHGAPAPQLPAERQRRPVAHR
jgi:hypothetical protein